MIDQAKSTVAAVAIIALTVVAAHWHTGRVKAAEQAVHASRRTAVRLPNHH